MDDVVECSDALAAELDYAAESKRKIGPVLVGERTRTEAAIKF
jgi:hypothetical protein